MYMNTRKFVWNGSIALIAFVLLALPMFTVRAADLGWDSYDVYDFSPVDYGYDVYDYSTPDYSYDVYDYSSDDYSYDVYDYTPDYDDSYDVYDYTPSYGSGSSGYPTSYFSGSGYLGGGYITGGGYLGGGYLPTRPNTPSHNPPVVVPGGNGGNQDQDQDQEQNQTSNNTNTNTNNIHNVNNNPVNVNVNVQVPAVNVPPPTVVYVPTPTPTYPAPVCTMNVSYNYSYGYQPVTLSWTSQNATSGFISNGVGSVALSGSIVVNPQYTTTYTGTFYGHNGQSVTCSATVNRSVVYNTPFVALSSVPYTGLELGFWGTVAYYGFLVLWCLVAAYLIVVKKIQNKILASLNSFLFGSATQVATVAPAVAASAVSYSAPAASKVDATDEFILSQINKIGR